MTALERAIKLGRKEDIEVLLNLGTDVNEKTEDGDIALFCALSSSNEIMEFLLDRGAYVNARDHCGLTPLMNIVSYGWRWDARKAENLIKHGADVHAKDNMMGDTALMYAVKGGNAEAVRFLLRHGADVNAINNGWDSPLDHASSQEIRDILHAHGAKEGGFLAWLFK